MNKRVSVCIKKYRPLVLFGFAGEKLGTLLEKKVYTFKIKVLTNIKVYVPYFVFFNENKIVKIGGFLS